MNDQRKASALADLRAKIIQELTIERWRDAWFFPPSNGYRDVPQGICGWQGTGDVLLVGLNPSTGQFPNEADKFLYGELRDNDLGEAHLTDVIKVRATGSEVKLMLKNPNLMRQQRDYFLEEIDILAPRLLVPMGRQAADALTAWLPGSKIVRAIPHYSPRIRSQENLERFRVRLRAVGTEYRGTAARARGLA